MLMLQELFSPAIEFTTMSAPKEAIYASGQFHFIYLYTFAMAIE
jgi:hypothetical protein